MDGPQSKKVELEENMNALSLRDLLILKNFMEKGNRSGLFLYTEQRSADIILVKLTNIIEEVRKKQ